MSQVNYLIESGDFTTGQIIQRARIGKNLSVNQLAIKVGCSRNNIYSIENSKSSPSIKTFIKICHVLKINPEKLVINLIKEYEND